ncbi:MAG: DNA topoisomerase 3 [Waddliaceae bacterium]
MIVVLTEKPSVARDLAAHLGARLRKEGYLEGSGYQVTWAFGHLVGLKEPEEYHPEWKRWSLQSLPMLPERFQLKAIGDGKAKKQLGVVKRLLEQADTIICATDAGREGELIFRYIMEYCGLSSKPFKRLWLRSLTPAAIRTAFADLRSGSDYEPLYHAARCRSEADWIVGLNGTRNLTIRFGQGNLWSLGRVQTPVLAMIVERDDEIRHFHPEPFWELMTKYRNTPFKYTGKRFVTKEAAENSLIVLGDDPLQVDAVKQKKERQLPPQLFNLTELQREMNRRYGMSAAETLKGAQALYESKLITYPRTDSQYITADMKEDVSPILQTLRPRKPKETAALNLSSLNFSKSIVNDAKVTDHHAILPTGHRPGVLTRLQERIYDAIHIRLIVVFYPPCLKETTVVEASVLREETDSVPFVAKGTVILDPGWTVLYPKQTEDADKKTPILPSFTAGESGPHTPYLKEGETQPPRNYTESSLLGAMAAAGKRVEDAEQREALKEKGLGTPATRASIIETLIKRGYLHREKKKLKATDRGRYLVALIQDPSLKSADLTGEWESKLKAIEAGKLPAGVFMKEIEQLIRRILETSDAHSVQENLLGPCPLCGQMVIEGKRGYGCSAWKNGCKYVLWKKQQGMQLQPTHARRLLQKGILFTSIEKVVLILSKQGYPVQIPIPEASPRRKKGTFAKKN